MSYTSPPVKDPAEAARMKHQRLRWRMMYGLHEGDIEDRLRDAIGNIRREKWGPIDMTSNPYLHTWSAAAALYGQHPDVLPPEGGEAVADAIEGCGYWQLMQRIQRDALALRELPLRIEYDERHGLSLRPVPPYLIQVKVDDRHPDRPTQVTEWIRDPDDADRWVRVVTDRRSESHRAYDEEGQNVSARVLGGSYDGEAYPWRYADGTAFLPWVTYRASKTGWYWDPYSGREVVEGTLQLGVLYSYYSHLVRAASWSQRYAIGVEPTGVTRTDGTGVEAVETDAATLLRFRQQDDATSPVVGQWQPAADPEKVLSSIHSYERRLVDMAIGSVGVSRKSSDVRSGYSLAVEREDQRMLQRSYEPLFRRVDLELCVKVAALMGAPEGPWRINYRSIPKDPAEAAADLDRITKQIEMGLLSKVQGYMLLHPGLTPDEAQNALSQIADVNRRYAS